jgi:hypothetical protein
MSVVLLPLVRPARAAESRMAIAAVAIPATIPVELNRAFSDALPQALIAEGFLLKPPGEVDMLMGERPEFVNCRAGACLAEEAKFLQVQRLVVPRLEPTSGGLVVTLQVYDATTRAQAAEVTDRCSPCSADDLRTHIAGAARRLHAALNPPGTLQVSSLPPSAPVSVDGKVVGATPWSGELEPGDHAISIGSGSARVDRDVSITSKHTARVDVTLPAAAAVAVVERPRRRPLAILKWVPLGVGVATLAAGAALLALDGRGTCSLAGGQKECPKVYDTLPAGAGLAAVGGALVVTSVVLIVIDRPSRKLALGVQPLAGGAQLAAGGTF